MRRYQPRNPMHLRLSKHSYPPTDARLQDDLKNSTCCGKPVRMALVNDTFRYRCTQCGKIQ